MNYGIKIHDPREGRRVFESIDVMANYIRLTEQIDRADHFCYRDGHCQCPGRRHRSEPAGTPGTKKRIGNGTVYPKPVNTTIARGEVPFSNESLSRLAGVTAGTQNRLVLLGLLAMRESLGRWFCGDPGKHRFYQCHQCWRHGRCGKYLHRTDQPR